MTFQPWLGATGVALALALAAPADAQTTFSVVNNGTSTYRIDGVNNPTLNLMRGQTYVFQVAALGNPFWIKTVQSTGTGNAFSNGVTNNGDDSGTITFVVPSNAPATLFYNCEFHASMTGQINITGPTPVKAYTWGRLKALYRMPRIVQ